jgi:hypothetical protein
MDEKQRQPLPWYVKHLAAIIFISGVITYFVVGSVWLFENTKLKSRKPSEVDILRSELEDANDRIDALSRRIGGVDDVPEPVRNGLYRGPLSNGPLSNGPLGKGKTFSTRGR